MFRMTQKWIFRAISLPLILGVSTPHLYSRQTETPIEVLILASDKNLNELRQTLPVLYLADLFPEKISTEIHFPNMLDETNNVIWPDYPDDRLRRGSLVLTIQKDQPEKLFDYIQCFSYEPTGKSCTGLLEITEPDLSMVRTTLLEEVQNQSKKSLPLIQKHRKENGSNLIFPAVFVNGKYYMGSLYLVELVSHLNTILPPNDQLPGASGDTALDKQYPPITLYAIEDKKRKAQRDKDWEANFTQQFPNLTIVPLNARRSKGKKILKKANIDSLPAYVFDPSLRKKRMRFALGLIQDKLARKEGGYYVLNPQRGQNKYFLNRKRKKNQLDLYVMSQCPYGVQAEDAFLHLLEEKELPKSLKLNIRYIVGKKENKFDSLHGTPELSENIRQLIIKKHAPDKFYTYLDIRNKDYRSCEWEEAVQKAGIDVEMLKNNQEDGLKLLEDDFSATQELGISASPSFVWENQHVLASRDELKQFLGFNPFESQKQSADEGSCGPGSTGSTCQ
ncbi:hypothetical protein BVX98_01325 [bacterium F11]|nr:hypothetical protein BVX98_01325 [bacterium F11]